MYFWPAGTLHYSPGNFIHGEQCSPNGELDLKPWRDPDFISSVRSAKESSLGLRRLRA